MNESVRNQAALITGGAKRLGKEMASALAKRGFDLVIHYNSSENEAVSLANSLSSLGIKAVTLKANLLEHEETISLIADAKEALGKPLNLLINNASIFTNDSIENATLTSWDNHISSNLRAPFFLTQAFAHQIPDEMIDERGEFLAQGLVINMVDQRVLKPTSHFATYTLAKMALWSFTQTAAISLAPRIRVNAIGPGPTIKMDTQSEEHFSNQRYNTILRRGSNPQDIVGAMNYFIDSPSVTGQLICTDSGQHLTWNPKFYGEDY